jgi:diguanylate cyclase (GGDEF)-like protein/PAS domain S-box-containing protein
MGMGVAILLAVMAAALLALILLVLRLRSQAVAASIPSALPPSAQGIDRLVEEIHQRVLLGEEAEVVMPILCRRAVELFDLSLAWAASKEADGSALVQGCAGPAMLERYLRAAQIRWDATPAARGPAGRAMRLGLPQRIGATAADWTDLLAPFAEAGLKEGLAVPLRFGERILGAFSIYAAYPLDEATLQQVEDLVARVGVAVQVLHDQQRLRLRGEALGAAANAVLITDDQGCIEWVNEAFTRLSGYSLEEAVGHSPRLLRSGAQTDEFYQELWSTILAGKVWRGEIVERRKDGSLYTVEQTVTPMHDRSGRLSHYVVVHEDITDRKQAEEKIKYLSSYDSLTGLPNRSLFRERLAQAVARAQAVHQRLAVLFLDLDHFSRINDSMGHDLGDQLLAQLVERLTATTRAADTLARIGGDEFAVILSTKVGVDTAAILARRLISAVSTPYDIDGQEVHLGASVGMALYPDDGADADQLIKNADVAMYRAIHEAPNGYRFFSSEMTEEMTTRLNLERDLRRALSRDELVLYYQPQLDVLSGRVVGMEALVRWNHPELGLLAPGRFIPLAEETGLIIPLGELVLRLACRQIHTWVEAGVPMVPVAVNLAAHQFRRPGLAEMIHDIIDLSAIETRWLELELTESGIMEDAQAAEMTLAELAEQGLKISIDDFGTGYSSLSYLKRFPIHKLKIDQSFVRNLGQDEDDAAIARAIITLGHSLGMTVVSEGVETTTQLDYLRSQGCDMVQGFLFSRPVPADQIPAMLAGRMGE